MDGAGDLVLDVQTRCSAARTTVAIDTVRRWEAGWIGENPPLLDAWNTEAEFRDSRATLVAMEDTMSDLYAINLHVQERLERDWREEVRATEAAGWLDEAGILRNYKNGLPLRRLLRAGRIAGQQQLPDRENGSWWIRRLAKSRDAMAIQEARQRIRRHLPIDRNVLHDDWPVSGDYPAFWLELGKTVAAFGNLENELTSASYALTAPPADFGDLQPDQIDAHLKWYAKVEGYRADAMFALVKRFDELLWKDGRVPHTVRDRAARAARRTQDVAQCAVSRRVVRFLRGRRGLPIPLLQGRRTGRAVSVHGDIAESRRPAWQDRRCHDSRRRGLVGGRLRLRSRRCLGAKIRAAESRTGTEVDAWLGKRGARRRRLRTRSQTIPE